MFIGRRLSHSGETDDTSRLLAQVIQQQEISLKRQRRSAEMGAEAMKYLAGGATSSWQIAKPQAVWMSRGIGSKVYDVDGNEYVDMHGGWAFASA
ncbi:hypothetical protein ACWED2_12825 [Amycolatopsis sp. NPDC005003]